MIDPRISLAVQQANVAPAIDLFRQVRKQRRQNEIQDQLLPGQLALQQQQIQAGEQALQQGEQSLQAGAINLQDAQNRQDLSSIAQFAIQNEGAIQNAVKGDTSQLQQNLVKRISDLGQQGRNTDQSVEALQMLQSGRGAEAAQLLSNSVGLAQNAGLLGSTGTAAQRDRQAILVDLEGATDETGKLKPIEELTAKQRLAAVEGGLIPRAAISARERIAGDPSLTAGVAASEAQIEGAKEGAKISAKIELEPVLQAKIDKAKANVRIASEQAVKNKSNAAALNVYEVGISNLKEALGDTTTGPLSGMLPAWTASAQSAEGAISLMAPILKQMFRGAGEGTFTDKDQELLLGMIPTRKDNPEAIQAKLSGLDALVKAKLQSGEGMPTTDPTSQMEQPQGQQIGRFNVVVE